MIRVTNRRQAWFGKSGPFFVLSEVDDNGLPLPQPWHRRSRRFPRQLRSVAPRFPELSGAERQGFAGSCSYSTGLSGPLTLAPTGSPPSQPARSFTCAGFTGSAISMSASM
jgi:hypothetical protein